VDVYVPGCPPRPEQLIYALMMLQEKIGNQSGTIKQVLNLGVGGGPVVTLFDRFHPASLAILSSEVVT